MKRTLAIVMLIASSGAAADTSKLSMTEGQWEITSDVTMESGTGINGLKQSGPAEPNKLCLTKKSPVPVDPKSSPTGMTCSIKPTVTGSVVSWALTCKGNNSSGQGTGSVTYAGTTFSGSSETMVKFKSGRDVKVSATIAGKYLGACPK